MARAERNPTTEPRVRIWAITPTGWLKDIPISRRRRVEMTELGYVAKVERRREGRTRRLRFPSPGSDPSLTPLSPRTA
jgi:hypothetical protein